MNRFKLFLVLIVLGVVGILLGQNRQLISLKLFCPDVTSQSCLYRTPELPLAAWIGAFAIAGILSSLLLLFLNQLGTPREKTDRNRSVAPKETKVRERPAESTRPQNIAKPRTTSDWEETVSENWESDSPKTAVKEKIDLKKADDPLLREPQDIKRSGSTYSYKFRESNREKTKSPRDREEKKIDDVYDASYRTLNTPPNKNKNFHSDEEEEWI